MEQQMVIIVDQIGLLRHLYQYAKVAYIGGGFTKDGIHNVLEAAAFGKPVIWGPNDYKYQEAIGLRNAKGGLKIKDTSSLDQALGQICKEDALSKSMGHAALQYVYANAGATQKTLDAIKRIYVSPIDQKL
jgi:3-deoxy-D-manno-octulosonic-acid transferase